MKKKHTRSKRLIRIFSAQKSNLDVPKEIVPEGETGKILPEYKKNSAAKGEIVRSFFRCNRKSVSDPYPQGKQERV